MKTSPLVAIVGPTASGKSALAMQIAQAHNGEIIAADSRTIYRGLDIGTAKPTPQDQAQVPHHLLDIKDPDEPFSAAEFKLLATKAIDDITRRDKLPILVGGSGLFVDAVLFDYRFGPMADPIKRKRLQELSVEQLQDMCRGKHIALPINDHNKRHLVRAIELGGLLQQHQALRRNTIVVGITTNKETLRRSIEKRAHDMLATGVADEVRRMGRQYHWRGEALKGNIYRAFRGVVEGKQSPEEALDMFIKSDMALAKRQMTWFRRNPHIIWSEDPEELVRTAGTFLDQQKY